MALGTALRAGVVAVTAVATLVAAAGCNAGSRAGTTNATDVACDYQAPDGETAINVLAYNSSAIDPFTNTMVKSCSRDGVTLKHDPIDFGGQVTKTTATLSGDTGTYDIIETYSFVVPGLAAEDKLEPLDDLFEQYVEDYQLDEINESMRAGMSYEGKLYGLPMQAQMFIMAYRKDVFDDLGLQPPTTFEEMREAAKTIQESGEMEYPIALPLLANADITTQYEATLNSLGSNQVDPETDEPRFDSAEGRQALEELKSLLPYMDPQVTTFDQPKVQQQMFNGTAAMSIMFSGRMVDLTKSENSQHADDFAYAPPPRVEADGEYLFSRLSIDGWSIPKNTDLDREMLFSMVASSVSEDASKAAIPAAYPARNDMMTEENSPYGAAANETIDATIPPVSKPYNAAVTNAVRPVLAKVLTGELSVEDGAAKMQAVAEKAMAES